MLILTEKPSVALDFSKALACQKSNGIYENSQSNITIINCIGHLFSLYQPKDYNAKFEDWRILPIIPQNYFYNVNKSVEIQANLVIKYLREHRNDKIIIATDADREGEIIARECLEQANICNTSNIYRFWVSQALTEEVIKDGLNNALPLSNYDNLALQGFTRQHADWLVGMNFTRYITSAANHLLPVGRVQTAILSAINDRCIAIKNFVAKKYFEIYGSFNQSLNPDSIKGLYFDCNNNTRFETNDIVTDINEHKGERANLISKTITEKHNLAPQLYNLNALQKEAFRSYGYSAEDTLNILQSLYEELKCVSYPRTPSRVMGTRNVAVCKGIYEELLKAYPEYQNTSSRVDISISNIHCFNDKLLEAHHALIPLKPLSTNASEKQKNIYELILERFMLSFLPEETYNQMEFILEVSSYNFKVIGKQVIDEGWKSTEYNWKTLKINNNSPEQDLTKIDFDNLYLTDVEAKEKWTTPPKYFNEASILSFMENPKNVDTSNNIKLVGLGTPATRHTFIPKLLKSGYIKLDKKNIICTELGNDFLELIKKSSIKDISSIDQTTIWEEQLEKNPNAFYTDIVKYVIEGVDKEVRVDFSKFNTAKLICPLCKSEIRKGKNNWYCTGYKNGCKFPSIWENIAGAKINLTDVRNLLAGKSTSVKHCVSNKGKSFTCKMKLNDEYKVQFILK